MSGSPTTIRMWELEPIIDRFQNHTRSDFNDLTDKEYKSMMIENARFIKLALKRTSWHQYFESVLYRYYRRFNVTTDTPVRSRLTDKYCVYGSMPASQEERFMTCKLCDSVFCGSTSGSKYCSSKCRGYIRLYRKLLDDDFRKAKRIKTRIYDVGDPLASLMDFMTKSKSKVRKKHTKMTYPRWGV